VLLLAAALGSSGCRDRAQEQSERDARDHARLVAMVDADEALDRALKAADDASRAGDDLAAAALLEGDAQRAADAALAAIEHEPMETPWGRARQQALGAVVRDRRTSIASYAAATRGEDLDAKLAAVQQQVSLQQRALDAVASALAPPGVSNADAG
jgi:hypothetical protein